MAMEDRTEPASPKRREDARKRGEVAKSPELTSAVVLLVGLYTLRASGPKLLQGFQELMRLHLGGLSALPPTELALRQHFLMLLLRIAGLLVPLLLVMAGTALVAGAAQAGLLLASKPLTPDLTRIDPLKGLQRMLSLRALMELGKSVLKVVLVGFVLVKVLRESLPQLAALQSSDVATALGLAGSIAWRMAQQSAIALVAIGAIDYGFQRRQHEAQLRMTKQEVREELKQTEGDPAIRSRLRQRQREMARGRMMRDVPGATAVVTNPTQIAVALKYEAGVMAAPKVVAKGQRLMAQRIRQVAEEHGVPIVENKPLARSLFRDVEIGDGVPPELYRAVAEVLAFVYRLSERKPGSSAGSPRAEL